MNTAKLYATVVFDNNPSHAFCHPSKSSLSCIEIIFAPLSLSADEYLLEYLSSARNPKDLILVTSDNELQSQARQLLAKTLTVPDFLDFVFSKIDRKETRKQKEKPSTDCSHQMKRLLEIFEKRLEN